MMTYFYRCKDCARTFNLKQSRDEAAKVICEVCGGILHRRPADSDSDSDSEEKEGQEIKNKKEISCPYKGKGITCCGMRHPCGAPCCKKKG